MKKFLLGIFILITACQTATPVPAPVLIPTRTPLSTPVPVTPSPEPTLTLAPSPTPLPRFFNEEFNSLPPSWSSLQANGSGLELQAADGFLVFMLTSPLTWAYAIYSARQYREVHIEAQTENRSHEPAAMGLFCRYNETDGWYEFNIHTDGTYNVLYGKWLAVGVADYLPILSASSKAIQPDGAAQQIGLTCSESTLAIYINNRLIRNVDVSRYGLIEGKVGIAAASFENFPVITAFDWFKVSEP